MEYFKWKPILLAVAVVASSVTFGMVSGHAEGEDAWMPSASLDEAFEVGYIQVTGESDSGQRRYQAIRAATVVAQRNLLEVFKGVHIQGDTTVSDGMLHSDTVRNHVEGFLRGFKTCGQKYDSAEKYATVCLRLYLNGRGGVYDTLYPTLKKTNVLPDLPDSPTEIAPTPPPPSVSVPAALVARNDGIIIELAGLVFKPAIVNRILNEKGEILFDPSRVVNSILVERGTGGFTSQLGKAKGLLASWGGMEPMIIKAVETRHGTDVVISSEDATRLFAADQKTSFLSQARVVFVIN